MINLSTVYNDMHKTPTLHVMRYFIDNHGWQVEDFRHLNRTPDLVAYAIEHGFGVDMYQQLLLEEDQEDELN